MTALLDPEVKHVTGWVVTGVGQHAYTILVCVVLFRAVSM